jgi:hypothetical protein
MADNGCEITFVDLDETLFRTFAKVHVLLNGEVIRKLSNQEYNTYVLSEGESFDFSHFRDAEFFRSTSVPIPQTLNLVKDLLSKANNVKGSRVIILTAREDFQDKDTFLKVFSDLGIDVSNKDVFYIDRVGNLKIKETMANKKKLRILHYLSSGLYRYCTLIDDDFANINAFIDLKNNVPESIISKVRSTYDLNEDDVVVEFHALLAHDGSLVDVNEKLELPHIEKH